MSDLVSVVVPVYKVEDVIHNTINSIIHQSYHNIEVILVNDGSPDNSIEVALRILENSGLQWRVINQENKGLSSARNNGIKESKGEWVICVDSDDVIAENAIERMVMCADAHKTQCVFCGYKPVYDDTYLDPPSYDHGDILIDIKNVRELFLKRKIKFLAPGMLAKRTLFNYLSFDVDCPYDEDIHFMWQLFYTVDLVSYVDSDLYNYYQRRVSMVHSLKPSAYLKASTCYKEMTSKLKSKYPDDPIIPLIYPKYRLGGLHVLSRSNNYSSFKHTVIEDGYRKGIWALLRSGDFTLTLYCIIYCISLKMFYYISKSR